MKKTHECCAEINYGDSSIPKICMEVWQSFNMAAAKYWVQLEMNIYVA